MNVMNIKHMNHVLTLTKPHNLKMTNKKMLKVAFIHPDLGIGGAERLVLDVAGALVKQGHEIVFLTNHFDKTHAFKELQSEEYEVQVYGDWLPRNVFGKFQALCAYIRMIYLTLVFALFYRKKENPDVYFVDLIPVAIPILKLFNEDVIYYCHHPDLLASTPGGHLKKLYRKPIDWVELKSTAKADVLLVNSEYTASVFRKTFPEINKSIQVLYPTVAYSYQETVKKLKPRPMNDYIPELPPRPHTIFLSINRFHPAKKLDLAVLAMADLKLKVSKKEWERIFLIIAGGYDPQSVINANYFSELKELIKEKDLEEKIILLKSPSDEFKAELLLSCDCLIYTPTNEHFGIVPLEAMTVAKPVIACNSGGPKETIEHEKTGYLCEPNPENMSKCMYEILNKEKTEEMGKCGKEILEQKFSYNSFSQCLGSVMNSFNKKQI